MLNVFDATTEQNPYMIEMNRDDMLIDGCFFQECNTCYIPIFYHTYTDGTMDDLNTVLLGSHFMRRNTIIFDN